MKRNESVIKILSDLVAIDSQSYKGNIAIIDFLSNLFLQYSQTTQSWVRESDGVKGKNLIVKIPGKSSDHSLVFVCHMDTVPTSSAWETDPFILEENGGNFYGLGACDTKGGVAALIEAVFTLSDQPAYDSYLVFDGDEEVGSTGAHKFYKHFDIKNPHFIFIEPTDRQLHIAQRAILKLEITTHGKSTHASLGTPERNEKENAIYKIGKAIQLLSDDAKELAKYTHPYLSPTTQNFGLISGGTAGNVFADTANLTVDRRLLPDLLPQKEFVRIKAYLEKNISGITVTLDDIGDGFSLSSDNQFVEQIAQVYKSVDSKASIGAFLAWSEAGIFANKGDVVVLGPGSLINEAHRANEFVNAQELFSFIHIYQKIMTEIKFVI